jgi:hypothetical protein
MFLLFFLDVALIFLPSVNRAIPHETWAMGVGAVPPLRGGTPAPRSNQEGLLYFRTGGLGVKPPDFIPVPRS